MSAYLIFSLSNRFSFALLTFMSPPCLHSLFKCSSAGPILSMRFSSRVWLHFISFFNLNSAPSSCTHQESTKRMISLTCSLSFTAIPVYYSCPAWSHGPTPKSFRSSNEMQTPFSVSWFMEREQGCREQTILHSFCKNLYIRMYLTYFLMRSAFHCIRFVFLIFFDYKYHFPFNYKNYKSFYGIWL